VSICESQESENQCQRWTQLQRLLGATLTLLMGKWRLTEGA
jgi:hypothetical protein